MNVIVCVDDDMGMLFNHRRQSKDSVLRERILNKTAHGKLWMNHYTAKQFDVENAPQINVDDAFLSEAVEGDTCLVETESILPYEKWIEKLTIYRWNRKYPSDLKLDIDLSTWKLIQTEDFQGNSHEKITEEVYIHG